ncbi:prepilin peptidase [bacterium]|nr:MAG: prepilin peptidase [bacterium]
METLLSIYVALFGLALGSFLGLAAERLPAGESVVRPRSRCRSCGRQLAWYENFPILSYLFLRGQCRSCGARIPLHHLFLEAATAVLTVYAFHQIQPWPRFLLFLILFIAPVLLLIVIDFRHLLLPDAITLPGVAAGFLLHWIDGRYFSPAPLASHWNLLWESLLGALAGALTLLLLALAYQKLRKREGLGGGDVKFAAMLGALFGWKAIFFIFLLASVLGIAFGILLMLFRGQSKEAPLPFGSALGLVSLLFLFHGDRLIRGYLQFIRYLV